MQKILISTFLLLFFFSYLSASYAADFNAASTYDISDNEVVTGDIMIADGSKGLIRTSVTYDQRIFGVVNDNPILSVREASSSARPVLRIGDTLINVTNANGEIKKGDFITSSTVMGKGMRAGISGYIVGMAMEDAEYGTDTVFAETEEGRTQVKLGTVNATLRVEYAEITTARTSLRLLNNLNAAFFRSVQDPEKFTLTIRYIIAGIIAILAFVMGFWWVARTVSKAVEAMGRNPLARTAIATSVILEIILTFVGGIIAVIAIFLILRF